MIAMSAQSLCWLPAGTIRGSGPGRIGATAKGGKPARSLPCFNPCIALQRRSVCGTAICAVKYQVYSTDTTQSSAIGSPAWDDFAKAVSGEWEGATSSFGADGTVRELPPNYVPEAYREWEVKVVDWTHMTSTLAESDGLLVGVKRFMPTVGCEADAVAYVDESIKALKCSDGHDNEAKTISRDGSYSIGTRVLASEGDGFVKHRIEACIPRDSKARVRLVYTLQRNNEDSPWRVMNLDVFNESYVGEYEGGTDLRSCGGSTGYGEKPRTDISDICGTWDSVNVSAYECIGSDLKLRIAETQIGSMDLKDPEGIICLPEGVWSRVQISGNDVELESGCVTSPGKQCVVRREYRDGKLKSVVLQEVARKADT